jgi:hypothetical protein
MRQVQRQQQLGIRGTLVALKQLVVVVVVEQFE